MSAGRLKTLLKAVDSTDHILILPHNDPDPDAVASAVALRFLLLEKLGIEAHVAYHGIIGRAENRALVNYLGQPFRPLATMDTAKLSPIALVDTQPGAGNNMLPPETTVAVVIDHHPWREATAFAHFADVRSELGASATILTEYLQTAGLEPDQQLATALFYGIKTDTRGLSRDISQADVAAYFYLQPRIDVEALAEIERAQVPAAYFKSFAKTLKATLVYGNIAISYMGLMDYPDLAAEIADLLLRLDQIDWVICMGIYQDILILAVRTPSQQAGAGKLARVIVREDGTAGGHGAMAGGQVPSKGKDPEQLFSQLKQRALQYLNITPDIVGQPLIVP